MSRSEYSSVGISGMDWMISYVRWRSRRLPARGNNFSVVVEVAESFGFDVLAEKVRRMENTRRFLAGGVARRMPRWIPAWYYGEGDGAGIVCRSVAPGEAENADELPRGAAVRILFFAEARRLRFTFSHAVFDGVGAEKFIALLLGPGFRDEAPLRNDPVDIQKMKRSGNELRRLMKQFPERKILRLPEAEGIGENEFREFRLAPERYRALAAAVEKKYGPFSFSIFLLALILCLLERELFAADRSKEYVFVPMSVDLRDPRGGDDDMFFNRWSLMPLLVSRKILADGVPAAFGHLRELYLAALTAKTPRIFFDAAEAMKYVPFRLIDLFVGLNPAKTMGTLMFSFLNSSRTGAVGIGNLAHYPVMPRGNSLGFFANICNEHLNIIISRRPWHDDGAFDRFCRSLRARLEEGEA